ncbi:MAG: nucleotidyltransferase domain-containing protein [Salinibacter sp.]|uniref:nucleotidyltransferase domain-containing protein n=1 Tax=Salinibacter sp. TaxID=2065818 RepID=UPI0035D4BE2C
MPETASADIQDLTRRLRARLENLYGDRLREVVLYGSHARGEASEASDVDVMVVLEGELDAWTGLQRMSRPVYDLELETEEMITLCPISRTEFEQKEHPLLVNVHREGITV